MRKILIEFLFFTLNKKDRTIVRNMLKKTKKTRKSHKRGPYKARLPKIEPMKPVELDLRLPKSTITPIPTAKKGTTHKLLKMEIGDLVWFSQSTRNISPIASWAGKKYRRTYTCAKIGPNSTEVKRLA